jgi:hypothetical protein
MMRLSISQDGRLVNGNRHGFRNRLKWFPTLDNEGEAYSLGFEGSLHQTAAAAGTRVEGLASFHSLYFAHGRE